MFHDYGPNRPDSLCIMGTDIEIVWNCQIEEFGTWSLENQRIQISRTVSPSLAVDVLLHEILHALWTFTALDEKEKEEKAVSALSSGLSAVFSANPGLTDWLSDSSRR